MPKVATYEPRIIAALQQAGMGGGARRESRGVGISELVTVCKCSRSQVYKTIDKLARAGMVREVGKTNTGAKLFAWAKGAGEVSVRLSGEGAGSESGEDGDTVIDLRLDAVLRVVGLRRIDERVIVEMRDEAGRVLGFAYEPGVAAGQMAAHV